MVEILLTKYYSYMANYMYQYTLHIAECKHVNLILLAHGLAHYAMHSPGNTVMYT